MKKKANMMYQIEWSYPSSTNAKTFGFYDQGCYTVSKTDNIKPPKGLAGFATIEQARAYAETLGLPKSQFSK